MTERRSFSPANVDLFRSPLPRPLSPADELVLARAYRRTGDMRLRNQLVKANLRLVVKMAVEHDRTRGRLLSDLIQEGCIGLIEAISRFDPERGVRLGTYAGFWIRAHLFGFNMANARLVRGSRGRAGRRAFFRGEIAPAELSLDTPRPEAEGGSGLYDHLADPAPSVEERLAEAEGQARARLGITALADRLSPRERAILDSRLRAETPEPLRAVARRFGVSGERIRQLEKALLQTLRANLEREPARAAA
jgi:RNA polymerase sigma-32 factor